MAVTATHTQIKVFNPLMNREIEVDKGMVQILKLLWKLGISTSNTCENNNPSHYGKCVWISFGRGKDADEFFDIICRATFPYKEDESSELHGLYYRVEEIYSSRIHETHRGERDWDLAVSLNDLNSYLVEPHVEDYLDEYRGMSLSVSVRFPLQDKQIVIKILQNEVANRKQ